MTYTANIPQLRITNSTSYIDLLGLQLGLDRLQGESAGQYLKRLEFAAHLTRKHPYESALNEISLQLGVEPALYISLNLPLNVVVTSSIAGVVIGNNPIIPLFIVGNDTMWEWRMLSDVTSDLNKIVPSVLLVDDGPAFQIARQSNSLWAFSEPITGIQIQLLHSRIQVNSVLFNQSTPPYTLTPEGLLTFQNEPNSGTEITYNYIITPYSLVGSPIATIGFTDQEFSSIAETPNGSLAYQVQEFMQSIMLVDRSYWAQ